MDIRTQELIVKRLEEACLNVTTELSKLGKVKRYKIGEREMEYVDVMKYYENLRSAYDRELKKLEEMKGSGDPSGAVFLEVRQDT